MTSVFITSTGTEIGKTLVTASLLYQLKKAGHAAHAIKPIISGVTDEDMAGSDTAILAEVMGFSECRESWDQISPLRYRAPLAPSMAAALEGKTLDYSNLIGICRKALTKEGVTLIEGVGGSFVPLTGDRLVADWISDLGIPSIIVVGSYLGTISHTIATVEAMRARSLPISGIVVSESAGDNPDFKETCAAIEGLLSCPVAAVPRLSGGQMWQRTPDLTHLLDVF